MLESGNYSDGSVVWKVKNLLEPELQNIEYHQKGRGGLSQRNVGEIVYSTLPLTDANLHLLDGALIQGNGIYSDFVDYIKNIYTEDSPYFYHDGYILEKFIQPKLSYYNMFNSEYFAVFADKSYDYGSVGNGWKMFDGATNTYWQCKNYYGEFVIYNPNPLKLNQIRLTNCATANNHFMNYNFYGSNDGVNWTFITEGTNTVATASGQYTIDFPSSAAAYKYHRFSGENTASKQPTIAKIEFLDVNEITEDNTEVEFATPVMTEDYPVGLDKFAVYVSSRYNDSTYPAWKGIDGNTATLCVWNKTRTSPQNFYFYNPEPLNVRSLRFSTNGANNFKAGSLYGYNEETGEWELVGSDTNDSINAANLQYTFNFTDNTQFYRTYRISFTDWWNGNTCGFGEIYIDGYTKKYKLAEEKYFDDLKKNNCVGKFVFDEINNTVRLPKVSGIISATTDKNKNTEIVTKQLINNMTSLYGTGYTIDTTFENTKFNDISSQYLNYYIYIVMANSDEIEPVTLNIGHITRELDDKVSRKNLVEASVVIESYVGEKSWYRLYSDGWVEQGGSFDLHSADVYQANVEIMFLKPFKDINYFVIASQAYHGNGLGTACCISIKEKTHVIFSGVYNRSSINSVLHGYAGWYACGYSAEKV